MRLVLLGPPGAGKGSLAGMVKDKLNLLHISTGDIFRDEIKNKTELGLKAESYIKNGQLVPDEVVIALVERKLTSSECKQQGYILDGFPRTRKQAEDLDAILLKSNMPLDSIVYLDARVDLIVLRLTGRRVCKSCGAVYHIKNKPPQNSGQCDECGGELYQRPDDVAETIKNRMDVYLESTLPIVEYYEQQNKLIRLDGNKDTDILKDELLSILNEGSKNYTN